MGFSLLPGLMNAEQNERAFQKQPTIFLHKHRRVLAKKQRGSLRYYKDVGLGFKTPKEAIEGKYIDKKCPFTGNVSIRGRILRGVVVSTKMKRTIIVRRDYLLTCPSTTVSRRGTRTSPPTARPPSLLRRVTSSLSASAGLFPRPSVST